MNQRSRESGTASLEVVVLVPLLVLVALFAFQLAVVGWATSQASDAARAGARANSLGQNGGAAARRALPGTIGVDSVSVNGDTVTIKVAAPRVSPLPIFHVTRSVAIPVTAGSGDPL